MTRFQGYGQFCPISRAAEVLTERWTPLVVRELICGSIRFNDIRRGVPRMSPALLSRRLQELEHTGIIERRSAASGHGSEYHLTRAGKDVFPVLEAMGTWAQRWVRDDLTNDPNLDPDLLMWDVRRSVTQRPAMSGDRFVAQFDFEGVKPNRRRYWLLFENDEVDLCIKHPGFDVDLYIATHIRTLTRIWLGHEKLSEALARDNLRLHGSEADVKEFSDWFTLSLFAPAAQA